MSRLVNVGPGDICDRLSILALKVQAGEEAGRDTSHFVSERTALLVKLQTNSGWTGQAITALLDLGVVNAALWHAEDDLREYRRAMTGPPLDAALAAVVAPLAFRIQALNDRRAALVGEINEQTGHKLGSEK